MLGTFKTQQCKKLNLQVHALTAAMKAGNVQPDMIDSVVIGNVLSAASTDCPYVARHTALRSGLRLETPANTVNRLCGSGFQVKLCYF